MTRSMPRRKSRSERLQSWPSGRARHGGRALSVGTTSLSTWLKLHHAGAERPRAFHESRDAIHHPDLSVFAGRRQARTEVTFLASAATFTHEPQYRLRRTLEPAILDSPSSTAGVC